MRIFFLSLITLFSNLQVSFAQSVELRQDDQDSLLVIMGKNALPAMIAVHFESRTNDLKIKEWYRLPPDEVERPLFQIEKSKIPAGKNINDVIRIFYRVGDPGKAQPDKKYRYRYPFATGETSKIIQGYNGKFSHRSRRSKYAIDFAMAVGDTIYAAREGVITWLVEKNTEGGPDRSFIDKANEIVILHDDGTLGYYTHLDYEGGLVEIGDQVKKGQAIGICGLTGFTTLPHLHFVVRVIAEDGEPTAIPIRFERAKGKKLKKGKYFTH